MYLNYLNENLKCGLRVFKSTVLTSYIRECDIFCVNEVDPGKTACRSDRNFTSLHDTDLEFV